MLQITVTQDSGFTVYAFEANNTEYEVLTTDNQLFTVYSSNKSRSGRPIPKSYTLDEMAKRSCALNSLAVLISDKRLQ